MIESHQFRYSEEYLTFDDGFNEIASLDVGVPSGRKVQYMMKKACLLVTCILLCCASGAHAQRPITKSQMHKAPSPNAALSASLKNYAKIVAGQGLTSSTPSQYSSYLQPGIPSSLSNAAANLPKISSPNTYQTILNIYMSGAIPDAPFLSTGAAVSSQPGSGSAPMAPPMGYAGYPVSSAVPSPGQPTIPPMGGPSISPMGTSISPMASTISPMGPLPMYPMGGPAIAKGFTPGSGTSSQLVSLASSPAPLTGQSFPPKSPGSIGSAFNVNNPSLPGGSQSYAHATDFNPYATVNSSASSIGQHTALPGSTSDMSQISNTYQGISLSGDTSANLNFTGPQSPTGRYNLYPSGAFQNLNPYDNMNYGP